MTAPGASERRSEFDICLSLDGERAVVTVHGEVDLSTADMFAGVIDLASRDGVGDVVLDVAGLGFIGAAGMRAIGRTSTALRAAGHELVVRAAAPTTLRMLQIAGVSEFVTFDASPDTTAAGVEDVEPDIRRAGSLTADRAVVDAALRLVVTLAHSTVAGADGVSVTLERQGVLTTVAATDDAVEAVDRHQYDTGEGPCLSAKEDGRGFHVESLSSDQRWPAFAPLALEDGIGSILSTPLMGTDRPIGSLNIYSRTECVFGAAAQELAGLLAEHASGILVDCGADATEDEAAVRISEGLRVRTTIAHAEGILMARRRVPPEMASLLLFRAARTAEQTVLQQAEELVAEAYTRPDDVVVRGPVG